MATTEKEEGIESYLKERAKALGGLAIKFAPLSFVGLPDRIVLLPRGRIGFIELKRPKSDPPTEVQFYWLRWLETRGFLATWTDNRGAIDAFLLEMQE
jgi:hypothetical protein